MQCSSNVVVTTHRGLPAIQLPDGRFVAIPSGGEGDDPPVPPIGDPPPSDPVQGDPPTPRSRVSETFTPDQQRFINRLLKQQKEDIQRENQTLRDKLEQMGESQANISRFMQDMERQFNTESEPDPEKPFNEWLSEITPPGDLAKKPELATVYETFARERYQNKRTIADLKKTIDEVNKKSEGATTEIAAERKRREDAEARALKSRKDALLADILARNKVREPAKIARIYDNDVVYDEQQDRFRYRTGDGELVDPAEAISRDIADWMRTPAVNHGGSGSQGGRPVDAPAPQAQSILEMEKSLTEITQRVKQGGASHQDITAVMRLRRELKDARAKQAKAGAAA